MLKINSKNWPSPEVWVFIAQLVEQHIADTAEAMGFDAVEAPFYYYFFFFFSFLFELIINLQFN